MSGSDGNDLLWLKRLVGMTGCFGMTGCGWNDWLFWNDWKRLKQLN